jgi:hypothetical protein
LLFNILLPLVCLCLQAMVNVYNTKRGAQMMSLKLYKRM